MRYRGPSSSAHASSSWRAVHSAVGCSVTLRCTSRRLLWVSITSTNRTRKVAVGTVKKSNAIRSEAWFFKNVRHACDGGLRGRTMYFETAEGWEAHQHRRWPIAVVQFRQHDEFVTSLDNP